ncbi:plasmid mobilization protein [Halodesulfovibrio spirochaetisodalis]|uniref:plasmid mobilization protein n=1 Tax=Halodesulfovibrio spirochaetisodalis TaxID=1560234 RepID=UPI0009EE6AB2
MNQKSPEKKRKVCMKSYMTEVERDRIAALAEQCGLSASEFMRRVVLGQEVNSKVDKEAFLNLLKVNADLGRLGGLFKLALTDSVNKVVSYREVRRILHQIEDRQEELRRLISIAERVILKRDSGGVG